MMLHIDAWIRCVQGRYRGICSFSRYPLYGKEMVISLNRGHFKCTEHGMSF